MTIYDHQFHCCEHDSNLCRIRTNGVFELILDGSGSKTQLLRTSAERSVTVSMCSVAHDKWAVAYR